MKSKLFLPNTLDEAKEASVGTCNGFNRQTRWEQETPLFAQAILRHKNPDDRVIVDYGCGPGRIAKELLRISDETHLGLQVIGIDNSPKMREIAEKHVNHEHFTAYAPEDWNQIADFVYFVYCLQHIPAIEIRDTLQRIYTFLKDTGKLFYCSSDYRMAVRFDGGGFFDDRHLGVDLREELSRLFDKVDDGFTKEELMSNNVVNTMVMGTGGLAHPALVYKKKKINGPLFNASTGEKASLTVNIPPSGKDVNKNLKNLVLRNPLSPGDILVMTCAIRALHKAYPGEYRTDVRSPCQDIFKYNPYIIPLNENDADTRVINMQYPEIHKSGQSGLHFADGHRLFLAEQIGKNIPQDGIKPDIFLSQDETQWLGPMAAEHGYTGKYWVINAGAKSDYPLKWYPFYQQVVNILKQDKDHKYVFAQIGVKAHKHELLNDVYDMIGKTDGVRHLFRLIYWAEGVITCVSFPMHIAAALSKPCVVIAGGREGPRWEYYPSHRYIAINGCCPSAMWDGCWRSKSQDCPHLDTQQVPLCMNLIKPYMVADAVKMYYEGGILEK